MQRKVSKTNRRDANPAATSVKMQEGHPVRCTKLFVQHVAALHVFLLLHVMIVRFTAANALQR